MLHARMRNCPEDHGYFTSVTDSLKFAYPSVRLSLLHRTQPFFNLQFVLFVVVVY